MYIYHAQFYYNIYNTSLFLASLSLADLLFLLLYVPLDMWRQVDSRVYQVQWILSINLLSINNIDIIYSISRRRRCAR